MKKFTIISLNDNLFNEFSIEELEERFETDPFLLTSLFSLGQPSNNDNGVTLCLCRTASSCSDLTCACQGGHDGSGCSYKNLGSCPELNCTCDGGYS